MNDETVSTELAKDRLAEDLRAVVADTDELLRSTASQAGEKVAAARAGLRESVQGARERLIASEERLVQRTKQAARVTDQYVHDNAWKSMGVALSVGVVVGLLIGRR
jgi:ElaB/YqjD/DUF883 family membrane-anchored ribosome-binding protein